MQYNQRLHQQNDRNNSFLKKSSHKVILDTYGSMIENKAALTG